MKICNTLHVHNRSRTRYGIPFKYFGVDEFFNVGQVRLVSLKITELSLNLDKVKNPLDM